MKSVDQDGGVSQGKWIRTRRANLLRLSGEPPKTLCIDQLNLTVCCRYAESLVKNLRINRYLAKHHPSALRKMEKLLDEFERQSFDAPRSESRPSKKDHRSP